MDDGMIEVTIRVDAEDLAIALQLPGFDLAQCVRNRLSLAAADARLRIMEATKMEQRDDQQDDPGLRPIEDGNHSVPDRTAG